MICTECEFFCGYNRDDGIPICDYDNGDDCPYQEQGEIKADNDTISVSINSDDLARRISSAFNNSVSGLVNSTISGYMREEYEKRIREMTEAELSKRIAMQVEAYMKETITIGGGWGEPKQELSRDEYLSQTIKTLIDKKHPQENYERELERIANEAIKKWSSGMKQNINAGIASTFNEITRQNLTDNIVAMLMNSDSYRQLSGSVQALLK